METPQISNEAEQVVDSPAPAQTSADGKDKRATGRPKEPLENFISEEADTSDIEKLKRGIEGKGGKNLVKWIWDYIDRGVLNKEPPFSALEEYGATMTGGAYFKATREKKREREEKAKDERKSREEEERLNSLFISVRNAKPTV